MAFWDDLYSEAKGGMGTILDTYKEIEKAKSGSFQNARAEQTAARYAPEVEYQNRGEPVSAKPAAPERQLVGETPANAAVVDRKWLYIGGGAVILVAVVALAMARR